MVLLTPSVPEGVMVHVGAASGTETSNLFRGFPVLFAISVRINFSLSYFFCYFVSASVILYQPSFYKLPQVFTTGDRRKFESFFCYLRQPFPINESLIVISVQCLISL